MRKPLFFLLNLAVLLNFSLLFPQEKKEYEVVSIAFYNLENLYDIYDDPKIFDDDRTPQGKDRWTEEIYRDKIRKMAHAINQIGRKETSAPPALLGVCEIENLQVLEDLVKDPLLAPYNYGIVHYDSPDLRGIDVALLYQKSLFEPLTSLAHELVLYDPKEPAKRVFTRDQLLVSGKLQEEKFHIIVNHWPSRSGGEKASSHKRENAAVLNKKILDSIFRKEPYAKIISMGDFNDDPSNKSIKNVLGAEPDRAEVGLKEMYNPMATLSKKGIGSLAYRDGWNLFDQILVSNALVQGDHSEFTFFKAAVFNEQFLITPTGQYKGYPYRSFGSGGYTGGYSDHFPVYILLLRELN